MKTLIVSNCATEPFTQIFSCFLPDTHVSSVHVARLKTTATTLTGHDVVIVLRSHRHLLPPEVAETSKVIEVPTFFFSGYHPDASYVVSTKGPKTQIRSPAGAYHSIIAFGAFVSGLSIAKTLSLYSETTFNALRFHEEYDISRTNLLDTYRDSGLPIDHLFRRWTRQGCFMHTFNHPHVQCFVDIAREICKRHLNNFLDARFPFSDPLAARMIFPCYPEIAERRGTRGSHVFKVDGAFKCMDLATFVTESFREYERHGAANLTVAPPFQKKFESIRSYLLGV